MNKTKLCCIISSSVGIFLVLLCLLVAFLTIHTNSGDYEHNPYILAHRGGVEPDNTYENIVQVLGLEYVDGIEVDVQMSKDGVVVLFHDELLSPRTNGYGKVGEHTFNHLSTLNMAYNDPILSGYNFRITTLEEVIVYMKEHHDDKILHLDIKQENITVPIIDLLEKHNMTGFNVIFDASDNKVNKQVHETLINDPAFNTHKMAGSIWNSVKAYFNFMFRGTYKDRNLVLYFTNGGLKPFMSQSLTRYFHKKNIAVGVYGPHINHMDVVNHYIKKEFDYVLMDIKYAS